MYLDRVPIVSSRVGYGELGLHGRLGVDDHRTCVLGRHYPHAVSAFACSEVEFDLGGGHQSLHVQAAMNDVQGRAPKADFFVYADDALVAVAMGVTAGDPPRPLFANLHGARRLRLVTLAEANDFCFSLWLDPVLGAARVDRVQGVLGGLELRVPETPPRAELCVATVVTNDFVEMAADMLGSLHRNGDVRRAHLAIVGFEPDEAVRALAARHGATLLEASHLGGPRGISLKTAVYSVPQCVIADRYLLIDSDLFVLGSLQPPLATLDTIPETSMMVARDVGVPLGVTLQEALFSSDYPYFCDAEDPSILPLRPAEAAYRTVVNTGVVFARRAALLAAEEVTRSLMPASSVWNAKQPEIGWREQGVFNVALARLDSVVELDERYNVQALKRQPKLSGHLEHTTAEWNGREAVVLHFNGVPGKRFYRDQCKGRFLHVASPIFGAPESGTLGPFTAIVESYVASVGKAASGRLGILHTIQPGQYCQLFKPLAAAIGSVPSRALCLDSKAGTAAAWLALAGCPSCLVLSDDVGEACTSLLAGLPAPARAAVEVRAGDVPTAARRLLDSGERFGLVAIDLCGSTQRAVTNLLMAGDLLEPGGWVLLQDLQFPSCDLESVVAKARMQGWEVDALSILPNGPSAMRARPPRR